MEVPKAIKKEVAACKKKGKPCNLTNFKQFPREVYNEVIAELSGFSEINLASNGVRIPNLFSLSSDYQGLWWFFPHCYLSPRPWPFRQLIMYEIHIKMTHTAALPDSFANLTNLTELNLSNNSFTSIPGGSGLYWHDVSKKVDTYFVQKLFIL